MIAPAHIHKGVADMTALEISIILAMREASEENLIKALAYLSRIESEEMPAAAPQSAGGAA